MVGFRELLPGDTRRSFLVLGSAVLIVVIVGSLNVASLLRAWLPSRRREFLVRLAVGAPMFRVARQVVLETLVWAGLGAIAGLAVGGVFVQVFGSLAIATATPYDFAPRLDARAMTMTTIFLLVVVGSPPSAPRCSSCGALPIWCRGGLPPGATGTTAPR